MRPFNIFLTLAALSFLEGKSGLSAETPTPAVVDPANDMPLEIYKKLRDELEARYGISNELPEGVEGQDEGSEDGKNKESKTVKITANKVTVTKSEALELLKKDCSTHKDLLVRALKASQVIHREVSAMALEYCGDPQRPLKPSTKRFSRIPTPGCD